MSWWLNRSEHELTEVVPAAPDAVQAFYADLDNLRQLHPLIVSVRRVAHTDTPDGYRRTYRVRDRIPLGPLALPISYRTELQLHRSATAPRVDADARQFPRIRLVSTVHFEPVAAGTRLTEALTITAPRPLAGVTTRQALAAHTEMLAGIARSFG